MAHLTYNAGDRAVPGYAAADIDVTDEEADYLLAAMHSDGTPIWNGGGAGAVVDEGHEARLALRNRNTAWIEAALAADAAYAAAHSSNSQAAPAPAPTVSISATDGAAATAVG